MPDPHAAGSLKNSLWWVINQVIPGKGQGIPNYSPTMATTKPKLAVAGPFTSKTGATNWINQQNGSVNIPNPLNLVGGWLGSLGGSIGSGLEASFITAIKDLWDVVIGPLEVLIGGIIIILTLVMYFRQDIMNLISAAGGLAVAAA
jgi:hypothetical protein